jgi:energy-coupling factor transporter ATP-binding protein EcfA2
VEPEVLVMDEPFASLDAAGAAGLARLLGKLVAGGTAVVVLSQVVDAVLVEATYWIALDGGTVTASGTPAELALPGRLPAGIRRPDAQPKPWGAATGSSTPEAHGGQSSAANGATAPTPVLELRGVGFGYPGDPPGGRMGRSRRGAAGDEPRVVLQGIDLAVQPGEIVAVTGPNGAGKSTLLRHFNGLLRPAGGSVLVHGKDIAGTPVGEVASSVGLLFQHPRDQLFEQTAAREVRFGLDRVFGAGEAAERTAAALGAVNLSAVAGDHPAELPASGQRLLALATVLARRPSVLALDEPTVALDGNGLAVLDAAVRSAADAGAAVVLVTHDVPYARSLADRILTLDGGRLAGG